MKIARVSTFLALGLLFACGRAPAGQAQVGAPVAVEGGQYKDVTVAELQTMLGKKNFPLINVHVPFQGDLPNTDASIPFDQIIDHLDQLPADKNAPVVLYCRTGRMSVEAAGALVKAGYTNIYNLKGGFNAWRDAGLPLIGL